MKSRPILFSSAMINALRAGRKTQTRRLGENTWFVEKCFSRSDSCKHQHRQQCLDDAGLFCSYGRIGDLLWIRESFCYQKLDVGRDGLMLPYYKADDPIKTGNFTNWKPSIHMPRWANRLTLEITGVTAERLHNISDEDAIKEGIWRCESEYCWYSSDQPYLTSSPAQAYRMLWESLHGKKSWNKNPWVWVLEFDVYEANIDKFIAAKNKLKMEEALL